MMQPVIGLEIHAHLDTKTKLFCPCPNEAGAEPNTNICEVCTGQPGALPRVNARAIELAATAGLALGARVNERSIFSRKNYFYPDLPSGFQTSQLDPPICEGGGLEITLEDGSKKFIRLNRIHMEDDAGKCLHDERRGLSFVDLNRAGAPLIEIVTEPDLNSAYEAQEFLKKLHALLVRLEVTKGRLEEGEFRCDVNISLRPAGSDELRTRCELKNLNSFRFVTGAIEYEITRQAAIYEAGGEVTQETRLYDPAHGDTRAMRNKEEAHDYRYFPQPDLPWVTVPPEKLAALKAAMPEGPEEARARLAALGLTGEQAEVILARRDAVKYLDQALAALDDPKRLATLMVELLLPACQREEISPMESKVAPRALAALANLMATGALNRRAAYDMFPELFQKGGEPEALMQAKGVRQISDAGSLKKMAEEIVAANPKQAQQYRDGQEKLLSFFIGQLMKKSRGAANPKLAGEALAQALKG